MINEKERAASIIKRFADKYLDGKIDDVVSFPLSRLYRDKEFGCPSDRRFDFDDTNLMRAIYVLIFSDVWPGLSFEALERYEYRGDTMNTYNTMFGKPDYSKGIWHPGLEKFQPDETLKKKVVDFRLNRYNLIGNMIVLPNIEFEGETINRYRGCNHTHDFFDRFLRDFKAVLTGDSESDVKLKDLVKANAKYLDLFMNEEGFHNLISQLFLEDYIDDNGNPVISSKAFYYWIKDVPSQEYLTEAHRYIDFSNQVIEHRGKKMLEALKNELYKFYHHS